MTKLNYHISEKGIRTITIFVEGAEGGQSQFTGWNIDDAIRNANKRLNHFGFYVEKEV